eukprot:276032-Pelagomonas_calceolata.AAC.1
MPYYPKIKKDYTSQVQLRALRKGPLTSNLARASPIMNTRHALHFQGTSEGGVAGRVAGESRRRRALASRSMVDNPPRSPLALFLPVAFS